MVSWIEKAHMKVEVKLSGGKGDWKESVRILEGGWVVLDDGLA